MKAIIKKQSILIQRLKCKATYIHTLKNIMRFMSKQDMIFYGKQAHAQKPETLFISPKI